MEPTLLAATWIAFSSSMPPSLYFMNPQGQESLNSRAKAACKLSAMSKRARARDPENRIGKWVKASRDKMGLTMQAMGDLFGCTKSNIKAWEDGDHSPDLATMIGIARRSGMPIPIPHDVAPGADDLRAEFEAVAAAEPNELLRQILLLTFTEAERRVGEKLRTHANGASDSAE